MLQYFLGQVKLFHEPAHDHGQLHLPVQLRGEARQGHVSRGGRHAGGELGVVLLQANSCEIDKYYLENISINH